MRQITGNIVDLHHRKIFPGILTIEGEHIVSIEETNGWYSHYITPGLIDAHVHIESSMLTPLEFSKLVVRKGTIAVVTDPHEIANVLGRKGIDFMQENSQETFLKIYFTIPSCVPATPFDYSGSNLSADDVEDLFASGKFVGLSEMMNVPGVLQKDEEVMRKLASAQKRGLPIDGHAPGLRGEDLKAYIAAGISTDHECSDLEEALEKVHQGMKIIIREGSAAKNYNALKSLIGICPDSLMFCTDDSHPGDLIASGHINKIVRKAVADGFDVFDVLKIASLNTAAHYGLEIGSLKVGDKADFVIWNNLKDFQAYAVFIDGKQQFNGFESAWDRRVTDVFGRNDLNRFEREPITEQEIRKPVQDEITCIEVFDGELVTGKKVFSVDGSLSNLESDKERDVLKIVYMNRYQNLPPQVAYIYGVHLQRGAFATSITHDSHNIISVGCTDREITAAINAVIASKGGLFIADGEEVTGMPLPIAGIISDREYREVDRVWGNLMEKLKEMGCTLSSPFMTLSFMALIVIPELKIGEKGLFEYSKFSFIS